MLGKQVSTKLIAAHLKHHGWAKFQVIEDTAEMTVIHTGWKSDLDDKVPHNLSIHVNRNRSVMLFKVPQLASAPPESMSPGRLADLLMAIGFANFALALGRFSYDPSDGEITFEYGFPFHNASISPEQFGHILDAFTHTVGYWGPRVNDVCGGERTGETVMESFIGHARGFSS